MSPQIKKSLFFPLIILFIVISGNSYAWDGFDYDSGTSIEIGKGNNVTEGLLIEFFDWGDNEYHAARVISLQEAVSGSELIVEDLQTNKQRTFIME